MNINYICGEPKSGKSILAYKIALFEAIADKKVLIVSAEKRHTDVSVTLRNIFNDCFHDEYEHESYIYNIVLSRDLPIYLKDNNYDLYIIDSARTVKGWQNFPFPENSQVIVLHNVYKNTRNKLKMDGNSNEDS